METPAESDFDSDLGDFFCDFTFGDYLLMCLLIIVFGIPIIIGMAGCYIYNFVMGTYYCIRSLCDDED